jgi:hypothetical protein
MSGLEFNKYIGALNEKIEQQSRTINCLERQVADFANEAKALRDLLREALGYMYDEGLEMHAKSIYERCRDVGVCHPDYE